MTTPSVFDVLPFTKPTVVPGGYPREKFDTPEGLKEVMKTQCVAAGELFRRGGNLPVTAYIMCTRNPETMVVGDVLLETHARDEKFDHPLSKRAFTDIVRLSATLGEAIGVVIMYECWLAPAAAETPATPTDEEFYRLNPVPPSERADRCEGIYVGLETKDKNLVAMGAIKRYGPRSAAIMFDEPTEGIASGGFVGLMQPFDIDALQEQAKRVKQAVEGTGGP